MKVKKLTQLLEKILEDAKMERAHFGHLTSKGPFPTTEAEVTEFVKERTRIYRQSWIISPLEEALSLVKGEPRA